MIHLETPFRRFLFERFKQPSKFLTNAQWDNRNPDCCQISIYYLNKGSLVFPTFNNKEIYCQRHESAVRHTKESSHQAVLISNKKFTLFWKSLKQRYRNSSYYYCLRQAEFLAVWVSMIMIVSSETMKHFICALHKSYDHCFQQERSEGKTRSKVCFLYLCSVRNLKVKIATRYY